MDKLELQRIGDNVLEWARRLGPTRLALVLDEMNRAWLRGLTEVARLAQYARASPGVRVRSRIRMNPELESRILAQQEAFGSIKTETLTQAIARAGAQHYKYRRRFDAMAP
jgi:hypothetical protein